MVGEGERVVALDVGGTTIKGAVFDRAGRVCSESRRPTGADRGAEAVIESILALAGELASQSPPPSGFWDRGSRPGSRVGRHGC